MKQIIKIVVSTICVLINTTNLSFGQKNIQEKVDSLKYLRGDPFKCSSITWRIIAHKKDAIHFLIEKLDDNTLTNASDKCKKANLTVGDISLLTLERILSIPFFAVTGIQFDVIKNGCQLGILEYLESNRVKFKNQIQDYHKKSKYKLRWRQFDSNHLAPCYINNNINGRYFYY